MVAVMLPHNDVYHRILDSLNGETVSSLEDLKRILGSSTEKFSRFEFGNNKIILNHATMQETHSRIQKNYQIKHLDNLSSSREDKINSEYHSLRTNFRGNRSKIVGSD